MRYRGLQLDPFQQTAIRAIGENTSVIVAAPTGAGKTLIAEYALERCLQRGERAVYTAPIKALSNQKFRDFSATWGDRVGIMTGDVTINPDAQVLIMTTEIFRNTIFEDPQRLEDIAFVIFDEIHFLDDLERGTVWEESIIFAPEGIRFVFLSATVSNLGQLAAWISEVRDAPLVTVREEGRPVPLKHDLFILGHGVGNWKDLEKAARDGRRHRQGQRRDRRSRDRDRAALQGPDPVETLVGAGEIPALVFSFSRRECEEKAEKYAGLSLLEPSEVDEMLEAFDRLAGVFDIADHPRAQEMRRLLGRGVAYHHAGILPTLKEVVERLFTSGKVKLLFATDTFALGVNMPAKAVVLSSMTKYDGVRRNPLKSREYHQMAGRAGRRGIDDSGVVFAVVDPLRDRPDAVRRTVNGKPENVNSRFSLSYSALLSLYGRLGQDQLFLACERSFAAFQQRSASPRAFRNMLDQVRSRLAVLELLRYIEDGSVTPIGRRAALLHGYEISVAELYRRGVFHALDPDRLAALFAALVFEEKPRQWFRRLSKRVLGPIPGKVKRIVHALQDQERRMGVRDRVVTPGLGILAAGLSWARGADFERLDADTNASEGDLVRTFRMAIQLLRHVEHAFPDDDALVDAVRQARKRMNRGVVDAERQLRQGRSIDEPELHVDGAGGHGEPAEAPPDSTRSAKGPKRPAAAALAPLDLSPEALPDLEKGLDAGREKPGKPGRKERKGGGAGKPRRKHSKPGSPAGRKKGGNKARGGKKAHRKGPPPSHRKKKKGG